MAQVRLCDFQSYVWKHLCGILYFPNIAQYILSYKLFLLSDTWVKTASTKGVRYNDVIWFLRLDNNCLHFHLLWDTLLELKSQVRQLGSHIETSHVGTVANYPVVQLRARIKCQACERVSLLVILAFSHQMTPSFQVTPLEMSLPSLVHKFL